jgi:hypothetical protein
VSISLASPMAYTDALTALNTLVNDTDNFTFTTDLKNDALTYAWNDTYVGKIVWDSSTAYTMGTWQYPIPSALTTVHDIYVQRDTDIPPEPIDGTLYEIVAGNIQFNPWGNWVLDDNYTLYVKGFYKYKTSDPLDTVALQNYVINMAAQRLLAKFGFMKVFRFLQNDTSLADILNLRKQIDTDVAIYRQALQREFEGI